MGESTCVHANRQKLLYARSDTVLYNSNLALASTYLHQPFVNSQVLYAYNQTRTERGASGQIVCELCSILFP